MIGEVGLTPEAAGVLARSRRFLQRLEWLADTGRDLPALLCHLCDRPTTRRGHFGRFDAPDLPMCARCAASARCAERIFWWR